MSEIIKIQSLTPLYDEVEDRIRLCANYQDVQSRIDFMVTRAFMIDLLFSSDEFLHTYYPTKVMTEEAIQSTRDMTTPSQTNVNTQAVNPNKNLTTTVNEDIELYKNKEDLLVTLQLQYNKTNKRTSINFTSKNNHQATLLLDALNFQQVLWSIKRAIPTSKWGLAV